MWVSEGSDGAVFCCNAGGAAFRLGPDRVNWQQLGGAGITHISVGDVQNVVALAGGLAFRHTPANNDWARMPGDGGFTCISISSGGGRIVALAAGGRALAFDGGAWQPLPAPALESIDVGEGSLVAAAMGSYEIFVMQLPGAGAPTAPGGMPMGGMPRMMAESWLTVAQRGAWSKLDGGLSCVSAGSDGSFWGTNLNHDIYRRANAGAPWQQVPGKLVQVSATNFNRAVGVNAQQQIFEYNGK